MGERGAGWVGGWGVGTVNVENALNGELSGLGVQGFRSLGV